MQCNSCKFCKHTSVNWCEKFEMVVNPSDYCCWGRFENGETIKDRIKRLGVAYSEYMTNKRCQEVIEQIEANGEEELKALYRAKKAIDMLEQEWVPVDLGMPAVDRLFTSTSRTKISKEVLVVTKYGCYFVARFFFERNKWLTIDDEEIYNVSSWSYFGPCLELEE